MAKTKKSKTDEFWESQARLILCEDIRTLGIQCDLCPKEEACIKFRMKSKNDVEFYTNVGPRCALEIEATFRHFRKWSIRGGKLER